VCRCALFSFCSPAPAPTLSRHKESRRELSRFLFTRGLWLIVLEVVAVRCFGWQFNFDYHLLLPKVLSPSRAAHYSEQTTKLSDPPLWEYSDWFF